MSNQCGPGNGTLVYSTGKSSTDRIKALYCTAVQCLEEFDHVRTLQKQPRNFTTSFFLYSIQIVCMVSDKSRIDSEFIIQFCFQCDRYSFWLKKNNRIALMELVEAHTTSFTQFFFLDGNMLLFMFEELTRHCDSSCSPSGCRARRPSSL